MRGLIGSFKKKKPNIIMIVMDGTRYDAISKVDFYQELKKDAVFFSNLITYAPYTLGSLHALFSGMNGNENGVNGYYKSYSFDKKNCFTLTQYLMKASYHTEGDFLAEDIAPHQGFNKFRTHNEFKDDLLLRHSEILQQIKEKEPFFLFLHYTRIHTNLVTNVAKKYSDFDDEYFSNKEKNFSTFLEWTKKGSEYLKGIIEKIKIMGLYENSTILVLSDHGSGVGDRIGEKMYGSYLYDYTLKCFLYIIGKKFPKYLEIKNLVRNIDILPTILDFLKLKERDGYKKIQGKSFLPFVYGKEDDRIAYSETGGLGGPTPSPERHNVQCVRTNKWKLIYNKSNKKEELYDLEKDPDEKNNLIGKYPDVESNLWEKMSKIQNKF